MRTISLYLILTFSIFYNYSIGQEQLGQELIGTRNLDYFGGGVALDSIGHRVVIGAPQKNYGQYNGQVRVFDLIDSTWVQVGQDLNGITTFEFFGQDVAMSANGETIVVRIAQLNTTGGGYVQAYHLVGDTVWIQQGTDLTSSLSYFGHQIDINSSGSRIVIGSNDNYVQVFEWNDSLSDWVQLGATLFGSTACSPSEYFGRAVSMDGSGNRIIVGASNHDLGCSATSDAGRAAVFEWNGTSWIQLGQSLFGAFEYGFGGSVEISGNGNRIACGAANRFGKGRVFTYEYNDAGMWEQYGDTIQGLAGDKLGHDVNLSYYGCTLIFGVPEGSRQGTVKRYRLKSSIWTQDGLGLQGAGSSNTGAGQNGTIGINAEGSIVALGTPRIQEGICKVYEYPREADTMIVISSCGAYLLNGIEYSISGTYSQSVNSINSCDSIIQLELTIVNLDSSIVQDRDTLIAVQDSVSYQWYDCDTGLDISGETGQSFMPSATGNYAVLLSNGVCETSSTCININIVSIDDSENNRLQVYPNPAKELIYFGKEVSGELTIWSSDGRLVMSDNIIQSQSLKIDNLSQGLYVLRIKSMEGIYSGKFLVE